MMKEYQNRLRVEMDSLPENEALARSVAAAFAAVLDPTAEELTEIRTAVSEAVSNAIIHAYGPAAEETEAGTAPGTVVLEFHALPERKLMIVVEDKGIGIEDVARAMEPLFTTKKEEERSGMGFTVMESFMDRIEVESAPGKGTRVSMWKALDGSYGF
ncbi:MAG: anti-sigma F factor [Bacillota bacterium]|nr:anti-sigma F factor [Bacillota bacterium]